MLRIAGVVFSLLMAAHPSIAQNLLVNPGFDDADQLDGWVCLTAFGNATWSTIDRTASPGSGSMEHQGTADADNRYVSCSQCVPVDELQSYSQSVWHFWPDDPEFAQLGQIRLAVGFYSDMDCTNQVGTNNLTIAAPSALDTWLHLRTDEVTAPATARSAQVAVTTWQLLANQSVQVLYDDLDFSANTLFFDGFESGDLSAWSSSVP